MLAAVTYSGEETITKTVKEMSLFGNCGLPWPKTT